MEQLLFTKVRDVKSPTRANEGDAGIDFYIPKLSMGDILNIQANWDQWNADHLSFNHCDHDDISLIDIMYLSPLSRVLIPSGIRVLINTTESMLMAANKSGVSTKRGLLYTAEIIDSPYTGEVHIGIFNASNTIQPISLKNDEKIMQFIHVPVILSTPTEISNKEYEEYAICHGTRGSKGFGSSDKQ